MKEEHKIIMKMLEEYLEMHPEQRFGQVLVNLYLLKFVRDKYQEHNHFILRDIYDNEDEDIISLMKRKQ